jgi:hypothetical protein
LGASAFDYTRAPANPRTAVAGVTRDAQPARSSAIPTPPGPLYVPTTAPS